MLGFSPRDTERHNGVGKTIIVICLVTVVSLLLYPLVMNYGQSLGRESSEYLRAQAELAKARKLELDGKAAASQAMAEEYQGRAIFEQAHAEVMRSYRETLGAFGGMSLQVGMALLIVILALGALWVVFNFGIFIGVRGVTNAISQYQYNLVQVQAASRELLPGGPVPVISSGVAANHLRARGYRVASIDSGVAGGDPELLHAPDDKFPVNGNSAPKRALFL